MTWIFLKALMYYYIIILGEDVAVMKNVGHNCENILFFKYIYISKY